MPQKQNKNKKRQLKIERFNILELNIFLLN